MKISHIRKSDGAIQTNEEHSHNVARLCEKFASVFGFGPVGYVIGFHHDTGKDRPEFQKYMQYNMGDTDVVTFGNKNHAYVGALVAKKYYGKYSFLIANPIAGHHRGLYNESVLGNDTGIMGRDIPEGIDNNIVSIDFSLPDNFKIQDLHIVKRFLFSCLVDADRLDTEAFMYPDVSAKRKHEYSMSGMLGMLENYINTELYSKDENSKINQIRKYVQECCVRAASTNEGFYSLNVPTGGGKTISSMLFGLLYSVKHNKDRIIIVVPYTNIIRQTAGVLRKIFGKDNVLEHHSNIIEYDDEQLSQKMSFMTENWDSPIIVTTDVQFFESMFSNKPSVCRKLHNISNSVIIFDEAHRIPFEHYRPIIDSFDTLNRIFRVSILFCTASQPVLSGDICGTNDMCSFKGLDNIYEIVPKESCLYEKLKRVELVFDDFDSDYDSIADRLSQYETVLCVVNTRKDAKEIFKRLSGNSVNIHLSRMMCSEHISNEIKRIRELLSENKSVRVISTPLIEAGVDIDFPIVFRQEAGLDSIIQAAGRCNREWKADKGYTYVFNIKESVLYGYLEKCVNSLKALPANSDWFSPDTMSEYFNQLLARTGNDMFDKAKIAKLLYCRNGEFETASNNFKIIEDDSISVIVNYMDSMKIIDRMNMDGWVMKMLSGYVVNLRKYDFDKLCSIGMIETTENGIHIIRNKNMYSDMTGVETGYDFDEVLII